MAPQSPVGVPTPVDEAGLAKRIERQIVLGTWGRVHNLQVEMTNGRLRIGGRTPSHYVKQLVLQAVIDVIGADSPIPVEFEIEVGRRERPVLPGENDLWGVPQL